MKRTPVRLALVMVASMLASPPALAQTPATTSAPAADAEFAAQKSAFLALPQATRKALQDALVWLGFYNGANDGDFGKRTRDSVVAWQRGVKATPDGVLGPTLVQALLAAADKARAAVGFQTFTDPRTEARVEAPAKLLAKGGTRLEFASSNEVDLAGLYGRLSAESPTRKVSYKAMKPGAFFVVSGQDGASKFYSRFETSASASPPVRGFTFAYPAAQAAQLDRIALAVANSFEAFPAPARGSASAAPAPPVSTGGAPASVPTPSATALVIAPGQALTALEPDDCPKASIDGKPARFERTDVDTGLAILSGDFGAKGEPPRLGTLNPDLVVLSAAGDLVAANSASLTGEATHPLITASFEKSASGGPVFDREGRLAGVVAPIADEPKRIAGVPLTAPHALILSDAIGAFLGGGELTPEPAATLSAGAIAQRERGAVAAVFCEK
jgi:peptidoglycan hydrolase-like protein with peptidoglycan-binding domain